MAAWEEVRHQVAIAGRVTDTQTGRTIGSAQVRITTAPAEFTQWLTTRAKQFGAKWATMAERPDQARTAADGHFHFLDLPNGQYTLVGSLPGSGSRYGERGPVNDQGVPVTVTVSRDASGNITMAVVDIALPPTTVKGQITGQDTTLVVMAEVRVKGSGERALSNGEGKYLLAALEKGERTVLVSAEGYQLTSQTALLSQAGTVRTLDFALVPSTS